MRGFVCPVEKLFIFRNNFDRKHFRVRGGGGVTELKGAWGQITSEEIDRFLSTRYLDPILQMAERGPDRVSLSISFRDISRYSVDLAEGLLDQPTEIIELIEETLRSMVLPIEADLTPARITITDLPPSQKVTVNDLRAEHIGKLVEIMGLVRTATEVRPRVIEAIFECQRCGHHFAILQKMSKFQEPYDCPNQACDRRGPFKPVLARSKYVDAQNIRVQALYEELDGGEIPQTLDVQVERDLTAQVFPGDVVEFAGVLRSYQRSTQTGRSTYFDLYLDCRGLRVTNKDVIEFDLTREDEAEIRDLASAPDAIGLVANSLVPYIHGHESVKRAIALQIFSSPEVKRSDGTSVRGDVHILLCGDPGVAKSQILRRAAKLSPRSVYTSGKSASGVGLTAAAVKDDSGRWTVEGGALVLADGGFACIDELDKIAKEDLGSIHEALEHQTISFMKAGINAILRCRSPVLAACNPTGERFDLMEPIASQLGIPSALLTRFDLVYALIDDPDPDRSRQMVDHILASYTVEGDPPVPIITIKKWISFARQEVKDVAIDEAAGELLKAFFVELRRTAKDSRHSSIPITVRQFEALMRLTKSAARLRLSPVATVADAQTAIDLMTVSMNQVGIDPSTGEYDSLIMETGTPKSEQDRMKAIKKIIVAFEKRNSCWPTLEQIQEDAEHSAKIPPAKTEALLDKMRRIGDVFCPELGRYKPVA